MRYTEEKRREEKQRTDKLVRRGKNKGYSELRRKQRGDKLARRWKERRETERRDDEVLRRGVLDEKK